MYIIQSKSEEYWQAIACREQLPESIVDELSSVNDNETHSILASNDSIYLSDNAMSNLLESSKKSDVVAKSLVERSDVPKSIVKDIYSYVGEQIQKDIVSKYGVLGERVETIVSEVVSELVNEGDKDPFLPSYSMAQSEIAKAHIRTEKSGEAKSIALEEMFSVLKLKKYKQFVAKFSVFMGVDADDAIEILSQKYGHSLAILCRAHGVDRSKFIKIFLLTDTIRSNSHIMKGVTLSRALAYYDKLSVEMSRELYQANFLTN